MYEWNAVFERREIVASEDGNTQEEILRRIIKRGRIEAEFGQDVINAVIHAENKTGNMIQIQMRRIES